MSDLDDDSPETEERLEKPKKRKKRKRRRTETSTFDYYSTFFLAFLSLKNALTLMAVVAGFGLVIAGFAVMTQAGVFGIPWLAAGFGLIVISLAMRFVFFPE